MDQTTCLCLVRHASTSWNETGRLQGRQDTPLSHLGQRQVQLISDELHRLQNEMSPPQWHAVYSSPLKRAVDTSTAVALRLGLEVRVRSDLLERAFGALEGLTWDEAHELYPNWRDTPHLVPGLESPEDLRSRAYQALEQIARAHRGENVIVVSHGGFLNAFLSVITSGSVGTGKTRLDNCAYTLVQRDHRSDRWNVSVLNFSKHLQTCR